MKKLLFFIFFLSIYTLIFSQEVKNALLIANNNYGGNVASLPRTVQEARELKRALESIGFDVIIVENANRESMEDALLTFKEKCEKGGGIAFFHYGGHAVQIDGVNYLLPANTRLDNISQVRFKCVNVENLMESMQGDANIVILDSCRNNPFNTGTRGGDATRGIAVVKKQPHNSIIIYSAHANKTAQDGVFTPILTQYITEKNISLEDVLKKVRREVLKKTDNDQYPGEYSQLTGSIYLAGRSNNSNDATRVGSQELTGFLDISVYTTCSIFVNNEYVDEVEGFSQKRFSLSSGIHKIKAKYKDGNSESTDVAIKSNMQEKWNCTYLSTEQVKKCVALSAKYLKGTDGVAKDYQKAFEYSKLAADAGDREGEYNVGLCFEEGLNVARNYPEAFRWYKKASEKGNGDAMWKVGTFYHYGKGNVKKDYKEAKKWYEKAISSNCNDKCVKEARRNLNEINTLIAEEEKESAMPDNNGTLWSLEASFGYNVSNISTKNKEISFTTNGFFLSFIPCRMRFCFGNSNSLDVIIMLNYLFGVKNFDFEKITHHVFEPFMFHLGYSYKWFAFHAGCGIFSLNWMDVAYKHQPDNSMANFGMSLRTPIDLEFTIYDRYIFYAEYSPEFDLVILPGIRHSFAIGFRIKIIQLHL